MVAAWSYRMVTTVNALIRKHLEWIYSMSTTRPTTVFIACCLVLLLSCFSISRITFEADIFKLFPQKGPLALFLDMMKWTGSAGNACFLLEGDREGLVREAELFAGKLQGLSADGKPAFSKVQFRIFNPAEAQSFTEFMSYAKRRVL
jgi:hypothetical protein